MNTKRTMIRQVIILVSCVGLAILALLSIPRASGMASARAQDATPTARHVPDSSYSAGPALAIALPDDTYDGSLGSMVSVPITVSGEVGVIKKMAVTVALNHTRIGDLVIKLQGPNGVVKTVLSRPGLDDLIDDGSGCCGSESHFAVTFPITFSDAAADAAEDMDAGPGQIIGDPANSSPDTYKPTHPLYHFTALDPNGVWTLYVADAGPGETGTLDSWSLALDLDAGSASVERETVEGRALGLHAAAGEESIIQELIAHYGAGASVRDVCQQLAVEALAEATDPYMQDHLTMFLAQTNEACAEAYTPTLGQFADAAVVVLHASEVFTAGATWGDTFTGTLVTADHAFRYAAVPQHLEDLGTRRTPWKDYGYMLGGIVPVRVVVSTHYYGFAYAYQPEAEARYEVYLPVVAR